jgi:hypothetical protein
MLQAILFCDILSLFNEPYSISSMNIISLSFKKMNRVSAILQNEQRKFFLLDVDGDLYIYIYIFFLFCKNKCLPPWPTAAGTYRRAARR